MFLFVDFIDQVFHCVHFECPAQEDGFEELPPAGSTPRLPVDAPLSNPMAEAAAPPIPPPLPDHFNPRRLDRELRNVAVAADEEEGTNLPSRFTSASRDGSYISQRSPRQ